MLGLAVLTERRYGLSQTFNEQWYYFSHPGNYMHLFIAGSLLALIARQKQHLRRLAQITHHGDALVWLALPCFLIHPYMRYPGDSMVALVAARLSGPLIVTVAFAGYVVGSPLARRILALPFLAYLGRISYSVFLYHALVLTLSTQVGLVRLLQGYAGNGAPPLGLFACYFAVILTASIALGALSYRCIEVPGMRGFRRSSTKPPLVLAA
jgi:peptidoglycan/LPS O-acetylase OafA/YrhL